MSEEQQIQEQTQEQQPAEPTHEELRASALEVAEKAVEAEKPPAKQQEKAPEEKKEDIDAAYNRIAVQYGKLERQVREQQKSLEQMTAVQQERDALLQRLKDPTQRYQLIEEYGGDYREWTDQVLSSDEKPADPRDKAIEELRARLAAREEADAKNEQEREQQAVQQQMQQAREYARNLVAEGEQYEFTRALGQSDMLIMEYRRRIDEGEQPTEEEVALAVEKAVQERVKEQLGLLKDSKSFNELLAELGYTHDKPARQERDQGDKPKPASLKTLDNDLSAARSPADRVDTSKLSSEELRERAARAALKAERAAEERLRAQQDVHLGY